VGFAISSNIISRVVPSLIAEGDYDYPFLGISSQSDLTLAQAQELGLDRTDGSLVSAVSPNGPADDAGIQPGDFIIAIDGVTIKNFDELISYLFKHKTPGETATLTIIRDGEQQDIDLVLGARP
jgi:2-alkenal reductase